MHTLADFEALVRNCIAAAEAKYGKMPDIRIRFDLKGRAAGMAGADGINRRTGEVIRPYLRFNVEAIRKHWDEQVKQTIPHEVAHIVAYCFPALGAKNHNYAWQMIDRSLGGTGERCHRMELTRARNVQRYRYVLDNGQEISVGPKHHRALQLGSTLRMKKSGQLVTAKHFKPEGVKQAA